MKQLILTISLMLTAQISFAQATVTSNKERLKNLGLSAQGQDRGGGDICEDRIKTIRDDIKSWITKGGANSLELPKGLAATQYNRLMLQQISNTKATCVSRGDQGYPVEIDGTAKVCRFDRSREFGKITCDFDKFQSLSASDQYVLIHHEFAGLAKIEIPNGDDSVYHLSNQISGYLVDQLVKKLAVGKKRTPGLIPYAPVRSFVGQTLILPRSVTVHPGEGNLQIIDGQVFRQRLINNSCIIFLNVIPDLESVLRSREMTVSRTAESVLNQGNSATDHSIDQVDLFVNDIAIERVRCFGDSKLGLGYPTVQDVQSFLKNSGILIKKTQQEPVQL